jgi:hypothetical protein
MSDENQTGADETGTDGADSTGDGNGARPGDERKRPTTRKKPTLGNPNADPQRIHREYVERHLGGGGGREATPDAYERAVEQWRRIPGAISRPPGEVRGGGGTDADAGAEADAEADESSADDTEGGAS